MNRRILVLGSAAAALAAFGGALLLRKNAPPAPAPAPTPPPSPVSAPSGELVRAHAPILGPVEAPVSVVEFFDPACEACRAFHPVVNQLREKYPTQIRIVLRYAAFHKGSDEAVRILETARLQDKFEPVLDALFEDQPRWAKHGAPDLNLAWAAAGRAGLDLERAKADRLHPGIMAVLSKDAADVAAFGVRQTPTFFIDGAPLKDFGKAQLIEAVRQRVEAL